MREVEVKKSWTTAAGLPALVLQIGGDHHCGYVLIPEGHPLHGVGYDDVEGIEAHGGLTFSGSLYGQDGWWLGFDCMHAGDDHSPEFLAEWNAKYPGLFLPNGLFRDVDYVSKECESLASQVMEDKQ